MAGKRVLVIEDEAAIPFQRFRSKRSAMSWLSAEAGASVFTFSNERAAAREVRPLDEEGG